MNEAQQQKEKEKLEYLSHLIATISPDPVKSKHCTKCNGKGSYMVDVAVHQGEIHYHVITCCGVVGTSPYAKIMEAIRVLGKVLEERDGIILKQFEMIQRDQFLWRKFVSFFNRKIRPIFKRKTK